MILSLMESAGVQPNAVSYTGSVCVVCVSTNLLLLVCFRVSLCVSVCEDVFTRTGTSTPTLCLRRDTGMTGLTQDADSYYTALITAAKVDGEAKSVALAEQMFLRLPFDQRNGRMYTAMIGAYSRVGRVGFHY